MPMHAIISHRSTLFPSMATRERSAWTSGKLVLRLERHHVELASDAQLQDPRQMGIPAQILADYGLPKANL